MDKNEYAVLHLNEPSKGEVNIIEEKNKDYLFWSIFNTLCCCSCFGIVALIFSVKSRENSISDHNKAKIYSGKSFKWNLAATLIGILIIALLIFLNAYKNGFNEKKNSKL